MPIFVSNKLFPIDVKYIEVKMRNGAEGVFIIEDEATEKKHGDKVKTLKTQWVQPNWKENNDIIRGASITDMQTGNKSVDLHLYRNLVLERFLKAWDIADDAGVAIPISKEKVMSLDFNIARALADSFINRNIPTEEELGN